MTATIVRLVLLTAGFAAVEIGLAPALVDGSTRGWVLVLLIGLPMILAGTAGFMAPLLGGAKQKGTSTDA